MALTQAQSISSEVYRIVDTISLGQRYYIFDMITHASGHVSLSMINPDLYDDSNLSYKQKKVYVALPTGCYIANAPYGVLFYGIENMIATYGSYDEFKRGITVNNIFWTQNTPESNTYSWKPHGIAFSKYHLLVCLWNQKFRQQSIGKVMKIRTEKNGVPNNRTCIEIQSDKNIPLYVCPTYIVENGNGDICVSDVRAVVVTDAGGMLRFRYEGNSCKSNFDPYGICCDSSCNIIVADMKNDKIHMVDKDGEFLHHVTYEGIRMPRALSIDSNDHVYVGEWDSDSIKIISR
eukprot:XP_019926014.1 PREDICTED: uncharacterized protein LOC105335830 [Crassostrea gigas]